MSKNKKQVIRKLRFIDFKDDERWDITTFGKLSIPVEERKKAVVKIATH